MKVSGQNKVFLGCQSAVIVSYLYNLKKALAKIFEASSHSDTKHVCYPDYLGYIFAKNVVNCPLDFLRIAAFWKSLQSLMSSKNFSWY